MGALEPALGAAGVNPTPAFIERLLHTGLLGEPPTKSQRTAGVAEGPVFHGVILGAPGTCAPDCRQTEGPQPAQGPRLWLPQGSLGRSPLDKPTLARLLYKGYARPRLRKGSGTGARPPRDRVALKGASWAPRPALAGLGGGYGWRHCS